MINQICNFIIKTTQEESILSGFQYTIEYSIISKMFSIQMNQENINLIVKELLNKEEVADVEIFDDCFDVVLYTDFAPNYNDNDEDYL